MKALEYLKSRKEKLDYMSIEDEFLNEAIAELEELQKPKTCNGCRWHISENTQYNIDPCLICNRNHIDRYEPKDSQ